MYIAPVSSFNLQPYSFKGGLQDAIVTQINGTIPKRGRSIEDATNIANASIGKLQDFMKMVHSDTILQIRGKDSGGYLELYNSLLDISIPIVRKSVHVPSNEIQIRVPYPKPSCLSNNSVTSCQQFAEWFTELSPAYIDELLFQKAKMVFEQYAIDAKKSAKAWKKMKKLEDAIIKYSNSADVEVGISRDKLREIENNPSQRRRFNKV